MAKRELKGAYRCRIFILLYTSLNFCRDLQESVKYSRRKHSIFCHPILAYATKHSSTPSALTSQSCRHSQWALFHLQRSQLPQNQTCMLAQAQWIIPIQKTKTGRKTWKQKKKNHPFSYWNEKITQNFWALLSSTICLHQDEQCCRQTGGRWRSGMRCGKGTGVDLKALLELLHLHIHRCICICKIAGRNEQRSLRKIWWG